MKFVLFVEGPTEQKAIPAFFKRWLDIRLQQKVGIKVVCFKGWWEFIQDFPGKVRMYLHGPQANDIIAIIGLLDLYGPTIYPAGKNSAQERRAWATQYLEEKVNDKRFRMFFAVHEIEAWLLSNPDLFPKEVRQVFPGKIQKPETVNFEEPPAKLLERLYWERLKKKYKKVTDGSNLFGRLSPEEVYAKCPCFKNMLDEMLILAKKEGL